MGGHDSTDAAGTVLVVDDDSAVRDYLARLLQGAGYRVVTVADGRQALAAARSDVPDLVISDVMMPHIDGLALAAALREDVRTTAVPVLLLSARAGLQAGADDYLVAPFSSEELLARVQANIALAHTRTRHAHWRSALLLSLQEAFFVTDQKGTVLEVNAAFADMLGYGPEGLPYNPPYPWWPSRITQADEFADSVEALDSALQRKPFENTFPFSHRDGHRVWVDISVGHAEDPVTGTPLMIGTFRDVTAKYYREQSQTALAELNEQLAQADSVNETLAAATRHLQRVFEADRVLAATFHADDNGEPDVVIAGDSGDWADLPDTTRARMIALAADHDVLVPDTEAAGAAGIALQHPAGTLVLWLEFGDRPAMSGEEQTLLTVLAGRLSHGLQRIGQIDEQRRTALALQHAMLGPAELPPGFAARYQPASPPLEVGGDWYDVIELGEGRIAMVVGDCVGHGLSAATVMGQLRSASRALLLQRLSPSETLAGLDRFAAGLPGAACTTACCAVLDTATGELTYSLAGHPPPILVDPDGGWTLLEGGRSIPLGLYVDWSRPAAQATLPAGAALVLYTDGLIERRGLSVDDGIRKAGAVLCEPRDGSPAELADRVMAALAPEDGYSDDVAVLAYRRPRPLALRFSARPTEMAPARAALRNWLARVGVAPQVCGDVLLAAGEAVTNAVEHGHRDDPDGQITLNASVTDGAIELCVADTGRWKTPAADESRGRGITLMEALMDDVTVEHAEGGTTVRMSVRAADCK